MNDVRKTSRSKSVDKIFDRLTVLVMSQELLMSGAHGPLRPEQKALLGDMVEWSKETAALLREVLDS